MYLITCLPYSYRTFRYAAGSCLPSAVLSTSDSWRAYAAALPPKARRASAVAPAAEIDMISGGNFRAKRCFRPITIVRDTSAISSWFSPFKQNTRYFDALVPSQRPFVPFTTNHRRMITWNHNPIKHSVMVLPNSKIPYHPCGWDGSTPDWLLWAGRWPSHGGPSRWMKRQGKWSNRLEMMLDETINLGVSRFHVVIKWEWLRTQSQSHPKPRKEWIGDISSTRAFQYDLVCGLIDQNKKKLKNLNPTDNVLHSDRHSCILCRCPSCARYCHAPCLEKNRVNNESSKIKTQGIERDKQVLAICRATFSIISMPANPSLHYWTNCEAHNQQLQLTALNQRELSMRWACTTFFSLLLLLLFSNGKPPVIGYFVSHH